MLKKLFIFTCLALLSSCEGGLKNNLNLPSTAINPPNEYEVMPAEPLYIPPNFTLRPPSETAKKSASKPLSKGEKTFINQSAVKESDSFIKEKLSQTIKFENKKTKKFKKKLTKNNSKLKPSKPGELSKTSTKDSEATPDSRPYKKEAGISKKHDTDILSKSSVCDVENGELKPCSKKKKIIQKSIIFEGAKPTRNNQ